VRLRAKYFDIRYMHIQVTCSNVQNVDSAVTHIALSNMNRSEVTRSKLGILMCKVEVQQELAGVCCIDFHLNKKKHSVVISPIKINVLPRF